MARSYQVYLTSASVNTTRCLVDVQVSAWSKKKSTCHIVSEKWVKHYQVSFEYPAPSPHLKGKTKVTMKKVVVIGIALNVISTYALLETG